LTDRIIELEDELARGARPPDLALWKTLNLKVVVARQQGESVDFSLAACFFSKTHVE